MLLIGIWTGGRRTKSVSQISNLATGGAFSKGEHTDLDNVADHAHDNETDSHGLGDLDEFPLVGCTGLSQREVPLRRESGGGSNAWCTG